MARGRTRQGSRHGGAVGGMSVETFAGDTLKECMGDATDVGRVLAMGDGAEFVVPEGTSAGIAQGLIDVENFAQIGAAHFNITFGNGDQVMVDLTNPNAPKVQGTSGSVGDNELAAAGLAMALHADPRHEGLTQAAQLFFDDKGPEALGAATTAIQDALMNSDGVRGVRPNPVAPSHNDEVEARWRAWMNDPDNPQAQLWELADNTNGDLAGAIAKAREEFAETEWDAGDLLSAIAHMASRAKNKETVMQAEAQSAYDAAMLGPDGEPIPAKLEDGKRNPAWVEANAKLKEELLDIYMAAKDRGELTAGPDPVTLSVRQKTARRLGLRIPKPDPHYAWDDKLGAFNSIVNLSMRTGRKSFHFIGPQGTGKNTYIYRLAEAMGAPVLEIDLSSGVDMRELIGDRGMVDGNTVELEGVLTQAACAPGGSFVVVNEIVEAPRGQLTAIHNLVGSGFDPSDRVIVIGTPDGRSDITRPVDPNTVFFATSNPDRADRRVHPALASRLVNLTFDYGSEADEVNRIGARVIASIGQRHKWDVDPTLEEPDPKGAKNDDGTPKMRKKPIVDQVPGLREEIELDVKMFRRLRRMYHEDHIRHCPDSRTMTAFSAVRISEKKRGKEDAVGVAALTLDFMWDQSDPPDVRLNNMIQAIQDDHPSIAEMASTPMP